MHALAHHPAAATYQDLLAVPDTMLAQIIDGELHALPRPASPHANTSSALGGELWGPFRMGRGGPGGWWILDEPELHLGPDVLVPDLAGWRREQMPTLPRVPHFTQAPDWICEVLSSSTLRIDRLKKLHIYAREGVSHVWLVDPDQQTLEVYALRNGLYAYLGGHSGEDKVRAEPFDAVELDLSGWWI